LKLFEVDAVQNKQFLFVQKVWKKTKVFQGAQLLQHHSPEGLDNLKLQTLGDVSLECVTTKTARQRMNP